MADGTGADARLIVITGCSGSGKSTLLEALAARGEAVVPEPGRRIVREQRARGGDALPWKDRRRFAELCAAQAARDHDACVRGGRRTFFDRGLLDVEAAIRAEGLPRPVVLERALGSLRYHRRVLVSAPWPALFEADAERRHTFADAVREYEALVATYAELGYERVDLPQAPVRERVDFVASEFDLPADAERDA